MKLVTWNVNGIRASYPKGLAAFVKEHQPDILCLQETKAHLEQVEDAIKSLGYSNFFWSSAIRKGYSGVATFHNLAAESKKWGKELYDNEGRVVVTQFPQFQLYNIYFPNGGSGDERHDFKQEFLKNLSEHLQPKIKRGESIVVVGDYNVAYMTEDVYDPVRLSKESGFLPEERAWFRDFLSMGFVDAFRHFHPDEEDRFSWWSYRELARPQNRGWRIDHICVTKNLVPHLRSAEILDQIHGSDHCPVLATFVF